jgi:enolase
MKIKTVRALEVLDSRGKPTVRAFVTLEDRSTFSASVPSGASTGSHEAVELRDNDKKRYLGSGVSQAVEHINTTISVALVGQEADPIHIDELLIKLDGTENKSHLGANAILAVSEAVVRAAAHAMQMPLWKFINSYYFTGRTCSFPRLMVNIVNGGKHAGWNFDIQEFMVVPTSSKPSESVRTAAEIFAELGIFLKSKKLSTLVGDEGGYSPLLSSNEEVFDSIVTAASQSGHELVQDFTFAVDSAASEFYEDGEYVFKKTNEKKTAAQLTEYYSIIGQKYHIQSFEDPFFEDDWDAFAGFTKMAEQFHFQVVGDDLFVTNPIRIKKGIGQKSANAVLIKPNQIGSILETVRAIQMTQEAGWKVIISHRSGETEDSFIADLAYGCGADFIKTGSMSRSERLAKYNRLLEIEAGF